MQGVYNLTGGIQISLEDSGFTLPKGGLQISMRFIIPLKSDTIVFFKNPKNVDLQVVLLFSCFVGHPVVSHHDDITQTIKLGSEGVLD